jgi:hypothetical protein
LPICYGSRSMCSVTDDMHRSIEQQREAIQGSRCRARFVQLHKNYSFLALFRSHNFTYFLEWSCTCLAEKTYSGAEKHRAKQS